jgi:hypothetical protein
VIACTISIELKFNKLHFQDVHISKLQRTIFKRTTDLAFRKQAVKEKTKEKLFRDDEVYELDLKNRE